jgi:adenylate kinase family enzyme
MRKKQIERARKRVESIREGERVKKKKEVVNKILDQYKEDNNGLIDLYKKIYSK